jgi:hypothetical protein
MRLPEGSRPLLVLLAVALLFTVLANEALSQRRARERGSSVATERLGDAPELMELPASQRSAATAAPQPRKGGLGFDLSPLGEPAATPGLSTAVDEFVPVVVDPLVFAVEASAAAVLRSPTSQGSFGASLPSQRRAVSGGGPAAVAGGAGGGGGAPGAAPTEDATGTEGTDWLSASEASLEDVLASLEVPLAESVLSEIVNAGPQGPVDTNGGFPKGPTGNADDDLGALIDLPDGPVPPVTPTDLLAPDALAPESVIAQPDPINDGAPEDLELFLPVQLPPDSAIDLQPDAVVASETGPPVEIVPEPATLAMLGTGLLTLGARYRRVRR